MLRSALEIYCKSPVRTFLAILRNPLWYSSAANCSPVTTNDVQDKEQQLLDTWLCESVFFKACPQSCGQAVTLNIPFVWAHFWGIWALGLAGLKQFVLSLDLCMEHCGERGGEQALPLCVTLGSSRAALSFCSQSVLELYSASIVHSKQMDFTEFSSCQEFMQSFSLLLKAVWWRCGFHPSWALLPSVLPCAWQKQSTSVLVSLPVGREHRDLPSEWHRKRYLI